MKRDVQAASGWAALHLSRKPPASVTKSVSWVSLVDRARLDGRLLVIIVWTGGNVPSGSATSETTEMEFSPVLAT